MMITYGTKVYRVEESISGDKEEIRAESAVEAAIKYLKHDALIVKSNDKKEDTFAWDLEIERIR
jgi:hypothetical protein